MRALIDLAVSYRAEYGRNAPRHVVAKWLGVSAHAVEARRVTQELKAHFAPVASPDAAQTQFETKGDAATVSGVLRVQSLSALLSAASVDLSVWEVERHVINKWEVGAKNADKELTTTPLWQVKAWLRRIPGASALHHLKAVALEEVRTAAPALITPLRPARNLDALAYIGLHDLHVGKLGHDWNSMQAREQALGAVEDLLTRMQDVGQIILPVGQDLMHVDSPSRTTTSGTPQDTDLMYREMRRFAFRLMLDLIERCRQIAPVELIAVPGNHGRETDLLLAEMLGAYYHRTADVTLSLSDRPRTYREFGVNLIGLTHGDKVKPQTLAMLMAAEAKHAWSRTTHREWLVGHTHTAKESQFLPLTEEGGVRVRVLPALSGTDYWHDLNGYATGIRACEAYLYDAYAGYIGHLSTNATSVKRAAA